MQTWTSTIRWTWIASATWTVICFIVYVMLTNWQYDAWKETIASDFHSDVRAAIRLVYASHLSDQPANSPAWEQLQSESGLRIVAIELPRVMGESRSIDAMSIEIELKAMEWSKVPSGGWNLVVEAHIDQTGPLAGVYRASRFVKDSTREQNPLLVAGGLGWGIGLLFLAFALLIPGWNVDQWIERLNRWSDSISKVRQPGALTLLPTDDLTLSSQKWMNELKAAIEGTEQRWGIASSSLQQTMEILQGMPIGVMTLDASLKLTFANRAAFELLNLGSTELQGKSIWELVRQPKITKVVREVREQNEANPAILEAEVETREQVFLRVRASKWHATTGDGVILTITDETRLQRLENMRREFTTNVSHELKTPLAAIKAYAETLLLGALDDPVHRLRFVERISEQTQRLENLIHDLLKLARIQDSPVWKSERIHIASKMRNAVEAYRAVAESRSISLTLANAPESAFISMDSEALVTILNNLISNAIRYTSPKGSVQVAVKLADRAMIFEVSDTGIGIPQEFHERIFERFFRVDAARSSDDGGTGLGLAIVKNIVQAIGGRVELESSPGHGSTFRVIFPDTFTIP